MTQGIATLDPIATPTRRTTVSPGATRRSDSDADIIDIVMPKRRPAPMPAPPPQATWQRTAEVAYDIWKERGCPHGDDLAHWFAAEALLRIRQRASYPRPSI